MAELTLFYENAVLKQGASLQLSEETARHAIQVLRMKEGSIIALTDGKGTEAMARVEKADKKKSIVKIEATDFHKPHSPGLHLAVAFTKHIARNEWLLEKAAELGVAKVIPLLTTRTEKAYYRMDRWRTILASAMIQSQQYHMPELTEASTFEAVIAAHKEYSKLLPHCEEKMRSSIHTALQPGKDTLILIGPEGDFTEEEVILGVAQGAIPVSLGATRLRTETAAIAACAYFHLINDVAL